MLKFSKLRRFFFPNSNFNRNGSFAKRISDAATSIKIGQREWKIGEAIYSHGVTAVEKSKMLESFGDQWATARVEGIIVGKGATKKVRVRWTNVKVPEEIEYGYVTVS
jgi:hypothetical protein